MLRIIESKSTANLTLKLEGSLSGVWVGEFLSVWRSAQCSLADRRLFIDLTGVDYVDQAGEFLLALIRRNGAWLKSSGVAMTELVRNIEHDWAVDTNQTREA